MIAKRIVAYGLLSLSIASFAFLITDTLVVISGKPPINEGASVFVFCATILTAIVMNELARDENADRQFLPRLTPTLDLRGLARAEREKDEDPKARTQGWR